MASRGQRLHETNAKDTSEMIHHHGVSLSKHKVLIYYFVMAYMSIKPNLMHK